MPNTYYKYKERDANSQINWAQVGADVNKMLTDEIQSREQKKAAIDKATQEGLAALRDVPNGESVTLREAALRYSDDATQAMLQADRLLKSGVMKPRDYTIFQQNINDGTEQAFGLFQEYQNVYEEKMQRFRDGNSSKGEVWLMENVEGFADLANSQMMVDPTTGKITAAKRVYNEETGTYEISKNPNDIRSITSLQRQIQAKVDKYNVDGTTSDWVSMNGSWVDMARTIGSRTRAGSITKSIDPTLKQLSDREIQELGLTAEDGQQINLYLEAETDYVKSIVEGPMTWNAASILTDHVGGYDFTMNPDEADENTILLETNSQGTLMPVLTEEQKAKAEGQLRIAIRNKIDKKEEISTVNDWQRPTAEQERSAGVDKENEGIVGNIGKLYYGNDNDVKNAEDFLRALNPNIKSIDRTGDGVVIDYADGSSETLSFRDRGQLKDQLGFIESAANFLLPQGRQITNVRQLAQRGGFTNRPFNATSTGFSAGTTSREEPIEQAFSRVAIQKSGLKPQLFVADDEDATQANIQNVVSSLPNLQGYTVETADFGNDVIVINDPEGKEVLRMNLDSGNGFNANAATQYVNQIVNLASQLTSVEDKAIYTQGQRQTITSTPTRRGAGGTQSNPNGVGANY